MKKLFLLFLIVLSTEAYSQFSFDFQVGMSEQDAGLATLGFNYDITSKTRIGIEFEGGIYAYRFIDTRAVENGFVGSSQLRFNTQIFSNKRIRFDFFTKTGLRFMQVDNAAQSLFTNYNFQNSLAWLFNPGVMVTVKAAPSFYVHCGVNLHFAVQISPELLLEQGPTTYLFVGSSYAFNDRFNLFGTYKFGPATGANGDTLKYFWKLSLGLKYSFSPNKESNLVLGY